MICWQRVSMSQEPTRALSGIEKRVDKGNVINIVCLALQKALNEMLVSDMLLSRLTNQWIRMTILAWINN